MAKSPKRPPKRGRPPLAEGQDRSSVLQVRLRPTEYARLREAAEAAGQPFADWCRARLLAGLETR